MKNLQIYAVQELSIQEMNETNGGFLTLLAKLVARTASIYKHKEEIQQGIDSIKKAIDKI